MSVTYNQLQRQITVQQAVIPRLRKELEEAKKRILPCERELDTAKRALREAEEATKCCEVDDAFPHLTYLPPGTDIVIVNADIDLPGANGCAGICPPKLLFLLPSNWYLCAIPKFTRSDPGNSIKKRKINSIIEWMVAKPSDGPANGSRRPSSEWIPLWTTKAAEPCTLLTVGREAGLDEAAYNHFDCTGVHDTVPHIYT